MAGRAAPQAAKTVVTIPQLSWDRVRPATVVLVSGTESFLAERAIRMLREILKAEDPSLEISDLEADAYGPGELITLASPSLFGEPRMIRVSGVEKCTDAFIVETLQYLESPADDTYLVLRHAGGARGKKLLDAMRGGLGIGIEIVCGELIKDSEKLDFAAAEFALENRRITSGALRALAGAFSDDLAELAAACQQLMADASEEITEVTVEKYYSGRVETNAFRVADVAIAGRRGDALLLLRHALAHEFKRRGGSISALQALMGHADAKTTLIYTHMDSERIGAQGRMLERMSSWPGSSSLPRDSERATRSTLR